MTTKVEHLYVHVPFCKRKCDYCAFHSTDGIPEGLVDAYLKRLDEELAERMQPTAPLRSVFVGGGTPNALDTDDLQRLLAIIQRHASLADDVEFTAECNPISLTEEKISVLKEGGVNRLSVGIQSFDEELRKRIGRAGDLSDVHRGLELAATTYDNLNCDLIFGIPGQTVEVWKRDLARVTDTGVTHISTYSLTIEPNTRLGKCRTPTVSEDDFMRFWEATDATLAPYGLNRYEVSNFAKAGCECRHNDEIWHGRPFAAAGPAAHGFDGATRYASPPLKRWLKGSPPIVDAIPAKDRAVELLIIGLRTVSGWSQSDFQKRTGYDLMDLRGDRIQVLCKQGLLRLEDEHVRPTQRGFLLNDWLGGELV